MQQKTRDPINIKKRTTKKQLDRYMDHALQMWDAWVKSISAKAPNGNRKFLKAIQGIVDDADRPLQFRYINREGVDTPMLFLPPRLQGKSRRVIMNRLDIK